MDRYYPHHFISPEPVSWCHQCDYTQKQLSGNRIFQNEDRNILLIPDSPEPGKNAQE